MVPADPPPVIAPAPPYVCPRCWGTGREDGDDTQGACILCQGTRVVEDQRLSGHFRLSELVRARVGYDQWPSVDALERLGELARHLLEPVRSRFGRELRVNSGWRCPSLDFSVAGSPFDRLLSGHSIGAAADVCPLVPDADSDLPHTLARLMEITRTTAGLAWDQAILEGGCVHLAIYSPYPVGGRRQRKELLVRCPAPPGSARKWRYEDYDGSEEQLTRCA